MRNTRWTNAVVLAGTVLVCATVGFGLGRVAERQLVLAEREAGDRREARIMEWVVAENPGATIREFAGFPERLVRVAAERGLDFRLLLAIALHESRMNPRAVGAAGEIGLWQIMPGTAAAVAKAHGIEYVPPTRGAGASRYAGLGTLADPGVNLEIAAWYFREQVDRFERTEDALRAYNRGEAHALDRRPGDRYAERVQAAFTALVVERGL